MRIPKILVLKVLLLFGLAIYKICSLNGFTFRMVCVWMSVCVYMRTFRDLRIIKLCIFTLCVIYYKAMICQQGTVTNTNFFLSIQLNSLPTSVALSNISQFYSPLMASCAFIKRSKPFIVCFGCEY